MLAIIACTAAVCIVVVTVLCLIAARRETHVSLDPADGITFVDAGSMTALLDSDPSVRSFFGRMSRQDILANANLCPRSDERPSRRYVRSVLEPTRASRERITVLVQRAADLTGELMVAPWRIAVLRRGGFGAQFPHTLGDVVCMPEEDFEDAERAVRTLVHERVHIFQRKFPAPTRRLLVEHWGLRRAYRCQGVATEGVLLRSNPDLDGWLWTETRIPDVVVAQVYTTGTPEDLSSSSAVRFTAKTPSRMERLPADGPAPMYEHPYERMAYELEALLSGGAAPVSSGLQDWWALWKPGRSE